MYICIKEIKIPNLETEFLRYQTLCCLIENFDHLMKIAHQPSVDRHQKEPKA